MDEPAAGGETRLIEIDTSSERRRDALGDRAEVAPEPGGSCRYLLAALAALVAARAAYAAHCPPEGKVDLPHLPHCPPEPEPEGKVEGAHPRADETADGVEVLTVAPPPIPPPTLAGSGDGVQEENREEEEYDDEGDADLDPDLPPRRSPATSARPPPISARYAAASASASRRPDAPDAAPDASSMKAAQFASPSCATRGTHRVGRAPRGGARCG